MNVKKAKVELTADAIRKAIEEHKPSSLTGLAHSLGYKGSVSSWLSRKFQALVPDIDYLLKRTAEPAKGGDKAKAIGLKADKKAKGKAVKGQAKPVAKADGKWPRDARNVFRPGSAYGLAFDILAAHPDGLTRARLVELLAQASGKDVKHAGYDAQVLLSARPNEDGLSNNDSPRHRSCRPGFYIVRTGDNHKLAVD